MKTILHAKLKIKKKQTEKDEGRFRVGRIPAFVDRGRRKVHLPVSSFVVEGTRLSLSGLAKECGGQSHGKLV